MKVEQIAVFLENKAGRLAEITQVLADNNVNIRALSLADTADFGILRLIVDDIGKAQQVLRQGGFTVGRTEVIVVEVEDRPGGLAKVLQTLKEANLNIEYMYALAHKTLDKGLLIFRIDNLPEAIKALQAAGLRLVPGEEIYGV